MNARPASDAPIPGPGGRMFGFVPLGRRAVPFGPYGNPVLVVTSTSSATAFCQHQSNLAFEDRPRSRPATGLLTKEDAPCMQPGSTHSALAGWAWQASL